MVCLRITYLLGMAGPRPYFSQLLFPRIIGSRVAGGGGNRQARQAGKTRLGKVTVPGVVTLEDGRGDSRDEATSDADEAGKE